MEAVKEYGGVFRLARKVVAVLAFATTAISMCCYNSAIAATTQTAWTSQEDFEGNAATTGEPTTRMDIDTSSMPGSTNIGPKQARSNGIILGRFVNYEMAYNPLNNRVYTSGNTSISVLDAATNETVAFFSSIGLQPRALVVSTGKNEIYVANSAEKNVLVFDGKTNNLLKTIPLAAIADRVVYNEGTEKIYITHGASNTISVVDGNTYEVVRTVQVGTSPSGGVYNPANNKVYVTNTGSNTVSVLDGTTDQVVATITGFSMPWNVVVNASGNKLYVVNTTGVVVVDTLSNQVTKTIPIPFLYPWMKYTLVYDMLRNLIYVPGGESLTAIDCTSDVIVKSMTSVGASLNITFSPVNNKLFVRENIIDASTGTVVATQRNRGSSNAVHDSINNRLYAMSDDVVVIDAMTSQILRNVKVGNYPVGGVVSTQSNKLFVIMNNSKTLVVVDTLSYQVVGSVTLPTTGYYEYPKRLVYNSRDNKIYVFYAYTNKVKVLNGETGAILKDFTLPGATSSTPYAVYTPVTNKIVVDGTIIDCGTDTAVGWIPVTGSTRSDGRAVASTTTSKVYIASYPGITVLDSSTNQVVGILASDNYQFSGVAFDAVTNRIFAANSDKPLYIIDEASGTTLETVPISQWGTGMVFFNDTNRKAFVVFRDSNGAGMIHALSDYAASGRIGGDGAKKGLRIDTFAAAGGSTLFDTYNIRYLHTPLMPGQNIRFRVRTADSLAGLSSASYFGPDGSGGSWYDATTPGAVTTSDGTETMIPLITSGATFIPSFARYVEIDTALDSNGLTPTLHEVKFELTTIDPPLPSTLGQLNESGAPIPKATNSGTVMFRVSGVPSGMFAQFELVALDSAFTGNPTAVGTPSDASGNSNVVLALNEGKYRWQARLAFSSDRKSLWTEFAGTLVVDRTPPAMGISSNVIVGIREDGATMVVVASSPMDIGPVQYPTATTWNCTISNLARGLNPVTVMANDEAGNLTFTTVNLYGF